MKGWTRKAIFAVIVAARGSSGYAQTPPAAQTRSSQSAPQTSVSGAPSGAEKVTNGQDATTDLIHQADNSVATDSSHQRELWSSPSQTDAV